MHFFLVAEADNQQKDLFFTSFWKSFSWGQKWKDEAHWSFFLYYCRSWQTEKFTTVFPLQGGTMAHVRDLVWFFLCTTYILHLSILLFSRPKHIFRFTLEKWKSFLFLGFSIKNNLSVDIIDFLSFQQRGN